MAKKSGKNIQKLLKKKQLQQLKEASPAPSLESPVVEEQKELPAKPKFKQLPSAEGKPILKTVIISAVILLVIFFITFWSGSDSILENFGNWLYESLKLGKD